MLLLLAAGVTFLAVTWDSLPVSMQAAIMATLAALALAGAVHASKNKLAGTAEAVAILGCGLLLVDLFGARELGLIPRSAIDDLTYAGVSFAVVAAINLMMSRIAGKVLTFGLTAVIAGQLPLSLFMVDRVGIAVFLLGLLAQVIVTLFWTSKGTRLIRITGAICSGLFLGIILAVGAVRVFLALVARHSTDLGGVGTALSPVLATTGVVCLAAVAGVVLPRKIALPRSLPPALVESCCTTAAAFTVATCLPQLPEVGRWVTTGAATALGLAILLRTRRTGLVTLLLAISATVVASVNILVCAFLTDVVQLGLISAIGSALILIAGWRKRMSSMAASAFSSLAAQLAILLVTADGFFSLWTGAITLAVVGACSIAYACASVGLPRERALFATATTAVVLAELVVVMVSPNTGTGVVLTIAAAPLVAYGMQPGRREALLFAGFLLAFANTAFVVGAGADTLEWFTLPPAAVMLAIGLLSWRDQPSWVYLGPGLLVGLTPSALVANSNDDWMRLTFVVAAAVAIMVIGARFSLQAPFVIGATVLAKVGLWQFLEVAPLIPRWITLGAAGAILLAVGATYERRLNEARQAARWITALR
ncbi:hypothetical protein GCM10009744_50010 [Kribbella alba]|uniref:DUF2339 domain-containing protein n=1 Tax=Kribbella alba TaxID=190197 RepID=A0ABP4RI68_9ACTN